jgi:hypothetical protein
LTALLWAACALLYVARPAHATDVSIPERPPDCTDADKRDSTGIVRQGERAVISFTLERDCTVSLWSYARRGPGQPAVESAVASGAGRHTLSVRACAQVDFVPGPSHEQGSGEAFQFLKDEEAQCETTATTTTSSPSPTSTSSTSSTSIPSASPTTTLPTTTSLSTSTPELAYGGPSPMSDALVTWAIVLACIGGGVWLVAREDTDG